MRGPTDQKIDARKKMALARAMPLIPLLLLGPCFLTGCSVLRSRLGMEPNPPPVATVATSPPIDGKVEVPSTLLQTAGPDRTGVPLFPFDVPRGPLPNSQTSAPAIPSSGTQMPMPNLASDPALNVQRPVSTTPAPVSQPTPSSNDRIAQLARVAVERYQTIDSYIARFRRRELVNGKPKPEELTLIKFRKEPWSVYFKWLGTEGHGREVVFVNGKYENKLHTLLAAGDNMLLPAGSRFSLAPDSLLVRNASRHTIQEAGIGTLIDQFSHIVAANARGDTRLGTLRYLGPIKRPELDQPCEAVEQTIPAGSEPGLAKGGHRLWVFDSASGLPVLVTARDDTNKEVEFYCYDRIEYPVHLVDDDFNPDLIWRTKPAPAR
jgi:Protein of unknown function (DUF1571)